MTDTHRYTVRPGDEDRRDVVTATLWAAGALGVWDRGEELVAWFPSPAADVPVGGAWEVEPDRDWQAEWKAGIGPVRAGRVVVVPTWLADGHRAGRDETTLVLDPGRAFGSGHHATTTQCLELLQTLAVDGARVLDVGTGTGILAIAAARLGAGAVVAVDVDPEAVAVARENAARNGVTIRAEVGSADVPGRYDIVLANLVTDTLVALAGPLVTRLRPGGTLIASGIAEERRDRVVAALERAGVRPADVRTRDGWAALAARRPGDDDGPTPAQQADPAQQGDPAQQADPAQQGDPVGRA